MKDTGSGADSRGVNVHLPAWLTAIGRQSPLALVLIVILWFFRSDGLRALDVFMAHQSALQKENREQRVEFLTELRKIELKREEMRGSIDRLRDAIERRKPGDEELIPLRPRESSKPDG